MKKFWKYKWNGFKTSGAAFVLILMMLPGMKVEAVAARGSETWIAGNFRYEATIKTETASTKQKPIHDSQAEHIKGQKVMIGVSKAHTTSIQASQSLKISGGDVASHFVKLEGTVGLAETASYTVTSNITYSLEKERSGKYRIEVWYPGKASVVQCKSTNLKTGKVTRTTRKSEYNPIKNGGYHKLVRYADLDDK